MSSPSPRLGSLVRLLRELKHRKVFRVAAVYAVVAFVTVQVADIVFPALHLPAWTITLVVALAFLGFPTAVLLAWAYELTPDGVRREDPAAQEWESGEPHGGYRLVAGVGIGVVVAMVGFGTYVFVWGDAESTAEPTDPPFAPTRSVAVLPFENLSVEEENAFFAAGIHGEVLTHLGRVADLRVISRTSVLPYAGTEKSMLEIGRELGVGAVMEGSVQRFGNQIRVTALLVDAATDEQLWAERYDRAVEDIFRIQTDIAVAITEALEATLTPEEQRRVEQPSTEDLEAYRLYVLGRGRLDQRTEGGMRRSIEYFRNAIERDSSHVLAWVGLADAHTLLHDYGYAPPDEVLPSAERAIERALELESDLPEAHASLGLLHATRREGPEAIRHLRRAVELQPGYAEVHNWRSWVSLILGGRDEPLEAARNAVELNPLNAEALVGLSFSYMANGQHERALEQARRAQEIEPDYTTGRLYEGMALYHLGRFSEAKDVLRDLEAEWAGQGPRATLALTHVAAGDTVGARALLAEIEEGRDAFAAGLVLAALGETEAAFDAFETVDEPGYWPLLALHHLYGDVWEPLRDDPRFGALLAAADRTMGLTEGNR